MGAVDGTLSAMFSKSHAVKMSGKDDSTTLLLREAVNTNLETQCRFFNEVVKVRRRRCSRLNTSARPRTWKARFVFQLLESTSLSKATGFQMSTCTPYV